MNATPTRERLTTAPSSLKLVYGELCSRTRHQSGAGFLHVKTPRRRQPSGAMADWIGVDMDEFISSHATGVYRKVYSEESRVLHDECKAGSTAARERTEAIRALFSETPCVYAMRVDGLVKIGYTIDPVQRRNQLRGEFLAIAPGDRKDEAAIHARLAGHAVRGREWYEATPEVLDEVNLLRSWLKLEPLTVDGAA